MAARVAAADGIGCHDDRGNQARMESAMTTLTTKVRQPMGLPREPGVVTARAPAAAAASGITPADVFRILVQRIFLILLVWFLGSAMTVGITLVTKRYFPLWTGDALIKVESPTPANPFDPWAREVSREAVDRNVADQANLIRDTELLRKALTSQVIRTDTDWFKQFDDDVDAALKDLDDNLVSAGVRGTSLLRVAMPTRNPKDSPKIVNRIVEAYMEIVTEASRTMYSEEAKSFGREVDIREQELEKINEELARLEREGDIPGMLTDAPTVTVRLRSLQEESVQRESELDLLRARWQAYRRMSPEEVQSSADLTQRVEADPKISALSRHVRDLAERREVLAIRLGPKHREIQELDRQMEVAEDELASLRQIRLEEERKALTESYDQAYHAALRATADLKESLEEATQMQLDLDRKRQRYDLIVTKRTKLERERDKYDDAHAHYLMVSRTKEPVRIYVYRRAATPLEPSRPRMAMWILAGVGVSLVAAVGLALGLNLLDTSLRTPRDVIRHAGLPLLGTVPVLDDEEAAVEDIETAARLTPHSLVAECFRQIRANLLFSAPLEQQRTILVSSASPSDGKTCVVINLGVTLAQGGRRILLIDANFRRPSLHKAFGLPNQRGLSNLLVGQGRLADFAANTDLPNLDVLVAGPCPPNPAELLASSYVREALAKAVEDYDQVIVDGPPVLLVSDAVVLGTMVDGVIMVCRARSSRGMVQRAKTQFGLVNARLIGAVLNAVETTRGGYFRKYYRAFYDYQEQEEEAEEARADVEALPLASTAAEEDRLEGSESDAAALSEFLRSQADEEGGTSEEDDDRPKPADP